MSRLLNRNTLRANGVYLKVPVHHIDTSSQINHNNNKNNQTTTNPLEHEQLFFIVLISEISFGTNAPSDWVRAVNALRTLRCQKLRHSPGRLLREFVPKYSWNWLLYEMELITHTVWTHTIRKFNNCYVTIFGRSPTPVPPLYYFLYLVKPIHIHTPIHPWIDKLFT